jgi:membrane-associated phospholipid phosphatase
LAAALLFLLLARWVIAGESMLFDLWIRDTVHGWATPLATDALLTITMLGSEWVMLPLGAVLVWRLATVGRWRQAILLAAGGLGAELVSNLLKLAFHRPRPPVFFGLTPAETYSFPSGHAFVATVFYGLLAVTLIESSGRGRVWIGKWIGAAAALMALLIGFSRVYLGYHYPTDVLGGWACAAAWLALIHALVDSAGQPQKQRH